MRDATHMTDLLDTPVRASFDADWQTHAITRGTAAALRPDIGPFAAPASDKPEDLADLAALVAARAAPILMAQVPEIRVPEGLELRGLVKAVQMVATEAAQSDPTEFRELGPEDAPEMLRLAQLTKPGPFELRTHSLGAFVGLHAEGALVAMAGQRMGFGGYREISGVCVHPDHRGQGHATRLLGAMIGRIRAEGKTPFLHTYADNATAIRLYESLGFELRAELNVAEIA